MKKNYLGLLGSLACLTLAHAETIDQVSDTSGNELTAFSYEEQNAQQPELLAESSSDAMDLSVDAAIAKAMSDPAEPAKQPSGVMQQSAPAPAHPQKKPEPAQAAPAKPGTPSGVMQQSAPAPAPAHPQKHAEPAEAMPAKPGTPSGVMQPNTTPPPPPPSQEASPSARARTPSDPTPSKQRPTPPPRGTPPQ